MGFVIQLWTHQNSPVTPTKCLSRNPYFENSAIMGNSHNGKILGNITPQAINALSANDRANFEKVEALCKDKVLGHGEIWDCVHQHLTEEDIRSLTSGLAEASRMPPLGGG